MINFKKFGPGLLLAATAIGVSHIVQSVQAGGKYGLWMIVAIILIHLIKYPFFLTSSKYVSSQKKSLLHAYFDIHPFFLILFLMLTVASMFTLQAVVTLICAAVIENIFHFDIAVAKLSAIFLVLCSFVLFFGRYDFLDKSVKPVIIILALATITALIFVLLQDSDARPVVETTLSINDKVGFLFLVSFLGWMPCPLDCVVWNSLWSVSKQKELKDGYAYHDAKLDFQVGYIFAAILAIVFLMLGYFIFYKNGVEMDVKAVPFIAKFLSIYTSQFGTVAFYIVAIAVLFTMLSTVITCLDGFPRVLSRSCTILREHYHYQPISEPKLYNYFLLLTVVGTNIVLLYFLTNMAQIIMIATLTSFASTAVLAVLNQVVNIRLSKLSKEYTMSRFSIYYSNFCVVFLIVVSVIMIYSLFA